MPDFSLTADAVFVRRRNQHHRVRDHYGSEFDQYVVLTERVGPYEEQTPVKFVLQDLVARIARLESVTLRFGSFTADAYIWPNYVLANAVIKATVAGSFTADARLERGFTADAWIQGGGVLTMDAWIV